MKEKNFKFTRSYAKLVQTMTDKQAGEFIKAICEFVFLGKPMESKDEYLKGVFVYVQNMLETEMRNRENGKLGGAIIAEKKRKQEATIVRESSIVSELIVVASGEQSKAENRNGAGAKPFQNQGYSGATNPNARRPFAK